MLSTVLSLLLLVLANAASAGPPAAPDCASAGTEPQSEPACTWHEHSPAAPVVTVTASAAAASEAQGRHDRSLARLEAIRTASGAGELMLSDRLSLSASRHAGYLGLNGLRSTSSIHAEAANLAGFSGADPFVRMRAVGYRSGYATELIGNVGESGDCVDGLMATVYHAALLLSRVTEVGLAHADAAAAGTCVIDLATPLDARDGPLPASRGLVRYPWPGLSLATGTSHPAAENPRPAPGLLPVGTAGVPVLVGLRNVDDLRTPLAPAPIEIQQFELRDQRNAEVPAVVLADPLISGPGIVADKALHGVFVVLVPRVRLAPGRYRVLFHATIEGGRPIAPVPWEFDVDAP